MIKDSDLELILQGNESSDEINPDPQVEIDPIPTLSDRYISWIESVDR